MSEERIHNPEGKDEGYEKGHKFATEFCHKSKGAYVLRKEDHRADATGSGALVEIKVECGYARAITSSKEESEHAIHLDSINEDIILMLKDSKNIYLERSTGSKDVQEPWNNARNPKAPLPGCLDGGPWKALKDGCKLLIHTFPLDIVPGGVYFVCDDIPALVAWLENCMAKGTWYASYIHNEVDGREFWSLGWAVPLSILIKEGLFKAAYLPE